jgi:hypothetical protein
MPAGEAGGEEGGGEESALLAVPPGSRNSPTVKSLEPQAKGKRYHPKKFDNRPDGARTRSYAAKYSKEKGSSAIRNVLPGSEINSLAKMNGLSTGIYENDQSTYKMREQKEEDKLFEMNNTIRALLEGLEKKNISEQDNESKT